MHIHVLIEAVMSAAVLYARAGVRCIYAVITIYPILKESASLSLPVIPGTWGCGQVLEACPTQSS